MLWRTEKKTETAISGALAKAGFSPRQMRLYKPAQEFIADGGTREEWIAAFDAVAKLSGEGPRKNAALGSHLTFADAGQANGSAHGLNSVARDGQSERASAPPPNANGGGHALNAEDCQPRVAAPVRSPTQQQLDAVRRAKNASALSVFERELTSTGAQWGNVYYLALDSMGEDGDIARAVKSHIGQLSGAERQKRVKELLTPREFTLLLRKVRNHAT